LDSNSHPADCNPQRRRVSARMAQALWVVPLASLAWPTTSARAQDLPPWLEEAEIYPVLDRIADRYKIPTEWMAARLRFAKRQDRALELTNPPADAPVIPRSLKRMLSRNLDAKTVSEGRAFMKQHTKALNRMEAQSGVPGSIVAGIIGVETRYGRVKGNYPALDTLATLAFVGPRRQAFFQDELGALFALAYETNLPLDSVKSSFAGALGIPQFMPSSWRRWGLDADGSGRANLIESPVDAIASVGNFLAGHGWVRGLPTHLALTRPKEPLSEASKTLITVGLSAQSTVGQIEASGLLPTGHGLAANTPASLIELPEPDEPSVLWLATPNFFAIAQYNRSYLYAASVASLARAISA